MSPIRLLLRACFLVLLLPAMPLIALLELIMWSLDPNYTWDDQMLAAWLRNLRHPLS